MRAGETPSFLCSPERGERQVQANPAPKEDKRSQEPLAISISSSWSWVRRNHGICRDRESKS